MKKKYIGLFIGIISFLVSAGQGIDSAYAKVTYQLSYIPDSTRKNKTKTDKFVLLLGEKSSIFFSQTKFLRDSAFNENLKNGTIEEFMKNSSLRNQFGIVGFYSNINLLLNNTDNQVSVIDQTIGGDIFYYTEKLPKFNWDILTDTVTILNYKCQKAITTFRGRTYFAWFCNQIPINSGPYKFCGLPGLIMRIGDTGNNYIYDFIGIENLFPKRMFELNTNGSIRTTREKFFHLQKYSFDNPWESLRNNGVTVSSTQTNSGEQKPIIGFQSGLPYNPIELE